MRNDVYYLAVDPGERNVGWAQFDESGETVGFGVVRGMDEFMDKLEALVSPPRQIIFENYRLLPGRNKAFSKVRTIELIGLLKRFCRKGEIPLIEQRNTDLGIGLRYLGMYQVYYDKKGKNIKHVDDEISALAHGVYYLTKIGVRPHRLDKTK